MVGVIGMHTTALPSVARAGAAVIGTRSVPDVTCCPSMRRT
ncbi:hypothetical protein [Modestobacter sp. I12A-02662]